MQFNILKITAKLRELPHVYVVYSLTSDALNYIGVCKMGEISYVPDARENVLFGQYFPNDHISTMEILYVNENRSNCLIHASKLIEQHKPVMNKRGYHLNRSNAPIVCNETGEVFQTMLEVVAAHKINLSSLSQHLHNRPRYKTIKGKTYKRGSIPEIKEPKVKAYRKIRNENTGAIFESAAAVAKLYGVTQQTVSNHLAGYLPHIKGNIFTRL